MERDLLTSELKGQRTLATVVFTDCVGFSARMSVDEDHTLDLIRRDLKLMKYLCEQSEGRVLKSTGDGLLMCFISAVKAVEYAIDVQKSLTEKASKLAPNDSLKHRIGIHLADIFINETDVMGNGVNIAARLQTLADPSGICISQTVYDVVKAGLHVGTRYLGPKELKNIREVVPVYKILLAPEAELTELYAEVIHNLEQNKNIVRIKKLLFYSCKSTWESSQNIVDSFPLEALLHELLEVAPTRDRLKSFLDSAVKTLSKPAEYALVANDILNEISKLYEENIQRQSPVFESANLSLSSGATVRNQDDLKLIYQQIAQELEQTGNVLRVKKLIFYVCRKRWENDQTRLSQTHLSDLVAELHQLAPTLEQLAVTLNEFVQTLSKQAEYALVANVLIGKFQKLYAIPEATSAHTHPATVSTPGSQSAPSPVEPEAQVTRPPLQPHLKQQADYSTIAQKLKQDPKLPRIKKLILYVSRQQWESNPAKLEQLKLEALIPELHQQHETREQLDSALNAVVKLLNKRDEYSAIARSISDALSKLYTSPMASVQAKTPESVALPDPVLPGLDQVERSSAFKKPESTSQKSLPSLFDYRLGVMKYANPLRAKLLLFSALQSDFREGDQDWLNLKAYDLDSLMRRLLSNCKTYTDLEALLYSAARRFKEPEDNLQTATTVIKCLRPFYLQGGSALLFDESTEDTRLNLDDFEETTLEFASSNDEDEFTRQVLASASVLTGVFEPLEAEFHPPSNQGATG